MSMDSNEADFIEELQREFLAETTFLLEQCEESYLRLESPENREEELGKIFRLAHSMKGGGAAVGFEDLAHFAHAMEDCLSLLRVYPNLVDATIVSLLLRAGDEFKRRVEMYKNYDKNPWDPSELTADLQRAASALQASVGGGTKKSSSPAAAAKPAVAPAPVPTPAPVASAPAPAPAPAATAAPIATAAATPAPIQSASAPAHHQSNGSSGNGAPKKEAVKIDGERIEALLDLVGELVVIKSQLVDQAAHHPTDMRLGAIAALMDKTIRELQDKTLSMRMTPLKSLFIKTQRVIRDLSVKLDKPVDFQVEGEETEIDRSMVDLLVDPLLHIARNSLDHGVENREKRKNTGKAEKGTIRLSAKVIGGRVQLSIIDDGAGINRDRILNKAIEKNLIPPGKSPQSLTDSEVFSFIFAAGFSTAETVTDVSGRGVGMDVVKTNVERMKGSITIESKLGQGTTITISVPLTTSIADGMLIRCAGSFYILPIDSIAELIQSHNSVLISLPSGLEALKHREQVLPVIPLEDLLTEVDSLAKAPATARRGPETYVIINVTGEPFALRAEGVVGQVQVVLKSLADNIRFTQSVSGTSILGDGRVALVLDPHGVHHEYKRLREGLSAEGAKASSEAAPANDAAA